MPDPIQHLSEGGKQAMDIAASASTVVTIVSHWAGVLTPILTFLIALATLGWWAVRWWGWFAERRKKLP